jgi:hypothetical protein
MASVLATITFPLLNQSILARAAGFLGGGSQLLCLFAATVLLFLANAASAPSWAPQQQILLYWMLVCLMLSRSSRLFASLCLFPSYHWITHLLNR